MLLHYAISLFYRLQGKTSSLVFLARTLPLGFLSPVSRWKTRAALPYSLYVSQHTVQYTVATITYELQPCKRAWSWNTLKGRGGGVWGVFHWWCTIGGDTALRLCECVQIERVTLPCGPHMSVFLFPMSSSTDSTDWLQKVNEEVRTHPPTADHSNADFSFTRRSEVSSFISHVMSQVVTCKSKSKFHLFCNAYY